MRRYRIVLAGSLLALSSYSLHADVKSDQKTKVEFGGMMGKMMNMFGGKAAKEGIVSSVAVKGDRKATLSDTSGQIIDLAEEKIYDLDIKKKNYKVTTFAELRRQMEEAKKKAEEEAKKADEEAKKSGGETRDQAPAENNIEIDFDVKETGQKKPLNGFDTRQVIMTITLREKGKTLEQSGGMVMTSDMWMASNVPALKEVAAFDMRYFQKLYGPMMAGASAQDMAAAMAMYPLLKPAMERMRTEGAKLDGTAILTTVTFESVKSAEQLASEQSARSGGGDEKPSASGGIGGAIGGFARRAAQRKTQGEVKPRATIMLSTNEVLKVVTDVSATDVAVPAGFKENK